jgi:hypothetical protein
VPVAYRSLDDLLVPIRFLDSLPSSIRPFYPKRIGNITTRAEARCAPYATCPSPLVQFHECDQLRSICVSCARTLGDTADTFALPAPRSTSGLGMTSRRRVRQYMPRISQGLCVIEPCANPASLTIKNQYPASSSVWILAHMQKGPCILAPADESESLCRIPSCLAIRPK